MDEKNEIKMCVKKKSPTIIQWHPHFGATSPSSSCSRLPTAVLQSHIGIRNLLSDQRLILPSPSPYNSNLDITNYTQISNRQHVFTTITGFKCFSTKL